MVNAAYTEKS
ncbi:Protein of unknown function [Streptococcus thermophilus]|nr:Protein of unknown function [Streptococcus thermophilus]